ncbi:lysophospholipase [Altererythrobacter atlanticus]|nr:alpha/beta hydrolase [Croceibacterium atlanticum]MBB5731221.1 lysophospholipase [Croceibacterium atlanticum]
MRFDKRAIPEGAVESRWTMPDGHEIRRLDWPAPDGEPRGSILFMPGRGDAYEKYLETYEHWRRRGWRVTAADWRGQAGSGRFGLDETTGHVLDFALWIEDLCTFWSEWVETMPGPHVLAGHSMGGHLVLRAAADQELDPKPDALILSAPMLDVHPEVLPLPVRRLLARIMAGIGDPRRPAWKWSEKPGAFPHGRQGLLTHDADRYADELWWREKRPELVMGPGSWGWVVAALGSIRGLRRPGALERVNLPVHILATSADRLVGFRAIRRAATRLPDAEVTYFGPEAAHEILREADPVRDRALAEIDRFLHRLAAK